jgi:diaminopimelate decarboxylase
VALATIATAAGTPTFVYSAATLRDHIRKLQAAFAPIDPLICFSVKSCPNLSVLRLVASSRRVKSSPTLPLKNTQSRFQ